MTNRIRALVAALCLGLPVLACSGGEGATGPTASLMTKVSGDEQAGLPGAALPQPLEVRVTDAAGTAVPGVQVTFAPSSGTVNPQTMDTDVQGRARTTLTLPNQGANVTVAAVAAGVPPVTFSARSVSNPIILTTTFLPAARQGLPYTRKMAATGGSGSAITFTATGTLPPGLTLVSDGTISGTPTQAGAFPVTIRANATGSQESTLQVTMNVCAPPAAMTIGEVRVSDPVARGACGIFLPSGAAGQRYRVGVFRTSSDTARSNSSTLTVLVRGSGVTGALASQGSAAAPERDAFPRSAVGSDMMRLVRAWQQSRPEHMRHLHQDGELVQRLGTRGLLPAQPPLRAPAAASLPETLQLDPHSTGTCTAATRVTAVRLAEDDRMAVYQDGSQNAIAGTAVTAAAATRLLNMYRDYGKTIIDSYFGGVPDADANSKIIVFITPAVGADLLGRVNVGDFYNRQTCAASNEGEYVYVNVDVVRPLATAGLQLGFYAVSHEIKHITSISQRVRRAGTGTPQLHPEWLEEGGAEIAAERIGRYAWSLMGGPTVSTTVSATNFLINETTTDVTTENLGVLFMMFGVQSYMSRQPNSVVSLVDPLTSDLYASGWTFLRWLGDAYGGAGSAPRADSVLFKRLNDQGTASGQPGLEAVVGRTWTQLMEEYTAASMVNGRLAIPRGFSSYDLITSIEMWCFAVDPADFTESGCSTSNPPGAPGAFPWPVTTDSQGLSESRSFADAEFAGPIGPSGLRVHDFVSNGTGSGTEVSVEITAPARVVVVRLR